jgi:hypothetical protein
VTSEKGSKLEKVKRQVDQCRGYCSRLVRLRKRHQLLQSESSGGWNPGLGARGLEPFWRFLKETDKARALGHKLELLKNADRGHYTQFFEE